MGNYFCMFPPTFGDSVDVLECMYVRVLVHVCMYCTYIRYFRTYYIQSDGLESVHFSEASSPRCKCAQIFFFFGIRQEQHRFLI